MRRFPHLSCSFIGQERDICVLSGIRMKPIARMNKVNNIMECDARHGNKVWYALRTFYSQEKKVARYLAQSMVEHFIPMFYTLRNDGEGNSIRHYYPVVRNLIFFCKKQGGGNLKPIIDACPYAVLVYTKTSENHAWCPISDTELLELRMICDRNFSEPPIASEHQGEMEVGKMVHLVQGPMKGIRGMLIRKNKKYYILKTVANLKLMFAVSRWCCKLL